MSATAEVRQGIVYGPSGKALDVHRPVRTSSPVPVVLLWHGRGPDERDVLAPLAGAIAAHGLLVAVPDWRPDAPDGGWAHLSESVRFTREHAETYGGDADRIVLAGWSLGALAGAGVTLRPERVGGWRPSAFVGIAGRYAVGKPELGMPRSAVAEVSAGAALPAGPVELVHGADDVTVPPEESRRFRDVLGAHGHEVVLTEPDADHAGVLGAAYDPARDRCVPAHDETAARGLRASAAAVARAAGVAPGPRPAR
ncbi:alpha/beta hydrolase [Streptomyces sp. RKND-216]|uniref:alpha/beta hydrolase n=1 Tax=Streptomyces sp. RKND-216 TaxID=2562581 RepID=UPI00109DD6FF|nr:alpha/beta hydrolase [Streptomyces sp. RKND-216]THA26553.1 alpha/beta hydrolase [Streptomyces sp. RKND-216]